jgi:hypothetical protein
MVVQAGVAEQADAQDLKAQLQARQIVVSCHFRP